MPGQDSPGEPPTTFTLDGLNAGDLVRVNDRCPHPECHGEVAIIDFMFLARPECGAPAEFVVDIRGFFTPLERDHFDPIPPDDQ